MDIDTTYMKSGGASRQIELPHACERHSLHEDDLFLTGFKVFVPQKKRFFIMAAQTFHIENMKSALNGKENDLPQRGKRTAGENIFCIYGLLLSAVLPSMKWSRKSPPCLRRDAAVCM